MVGFGGFCTLEEPVVLEGEEVGDGVGDPPLSGGFVGGGLEPEPEPLVVCGAE